MGIKEEYRQTWKFMKESKIYFLVIVLLFFGTAIIGFLFPVFFVDTIMDLLRDIFSQIEGMSGVGLTLFIILNNIMTSLMGMVLGILLGIIPIALTILNGYVLGFVSNMAVNESGFGALLNLVPHGIFELPALFIALGVGLKIGLSLFYKNPGDTLKYNIINSFKVFVLIVIPLLVVAGVIEGLLIVFFS
ncbi:MAG: stage II sporulation protein M [Nanoarchaeota archaeon]|nr:stage II sporulation protein M [Nanoarchaeota archaeon]